MVRAPVIRMPMNFRKLKGVLSIYEGEWKTYMNDKWKYVYSFGDRESVIYLEEHTGISLYRLPLIFASFRADVKQLGTVERRDGFKKGLVELKVPPATE